MIFIRKVLQDHKKTDKCNLEVTSDGHKQSPSLIDRVTTLFNYVYIENATGRVYFLMLGINLGGHSKFFLIRKVVHMHLYFEYLG